MRQMFPVHPAKHRPLYTENAINLTRINQLKLCFFLIHKIASATKQATCIKSINHRFKRWLTKRRGRSFLRSRPRVKGLGLDWTASPARLSPQNKAVLAIEPQACAQRHPC